jgi:peptidoglycan/LPS O-acetylase OafA/YrhL
VAQTKEGEQATIPALDGVRGVAILLVFTVHYAVAWTMLFPAAANDANATGLFADMAFSLGNAGVDLFMALSGYLIYDHLMRKPQGFAPYFRRRARRIFPPYLVVLAIYVGLMLLDPAKSKLPAQFAGAVIYIVECALLIPGFFGRPPIVGIAWSLTYEMLFYLLLPLLIFTTGLRRRGFFTRLTCLLLVATGLLLFAYHVQFHERTVMFISGMVVREVLVRCRYALPRPRLTEGVAIAGVCVAVGYMALWRGPMPFTNVEFPQSFWRALVLATAFPAMIATSLGVNGIFRAVFEFRPFRRLGEVSYSFYLLHNLTMRVALAWLIPHVTPAMAGGFYFLAMPMAFLVCLVPGLVLYALIERPFSLRRPVGFDLRAHNAAIAS